MEEFKKQLQSVCKRSFTITIIFGVIAVAFLLLAIFIGKTDYDEFNPYESGYSQMEVTYVMGPFAQTTEGGSVTNQYYIAENTEGYWFILGTNNHNKLPVYGDDVQDIDLDSLKGITVKGNNKTISTQMKSYVIDFFEDEETDLSYVNFSDYFGDYYLDTTDKGNSGTIAFYIISAVMLFIAVLLLIVSSKKSKDIKNKINFLEQNGSLNTLYQDFSLGQPVFSKKLRLAVSDHFVLDYSAPKEGFIVYPLENVNNVFKCNMINGCPTTTNYIALETIDGQRFCIAPTNNNSVEFNSIISRLKNTVAGGVQ